MSARSAFAEAPERANVIAFPRRRFDEQQTASSCSDCGATIIDSGVRIFCEPCIVLNDGQ